MKGVFDFNQSFELLLSYAENLISVTCENIKFYELKISNLF